jgi:hypothetical protein
MPPWVDNTFFDLCARVVLRGDVLYRDVFLHGPPGMVLLQAGIRSVIGWSSESLLLADFVVVSLIICLLVRCFLPRDATVPVRLIAATILYGYYFSTSEWCHAQPDVWMLLLALVALWLRCRQTESFAGGQSALNRAIVRSGCEGLCWGAGFIIKPFIAVPAIVCWLLAAALIYRRRPTWKLLLGDCSGLLLGVFFVGALTVGWLHSSGNWPYFLEGFLGDWNQEYYETSAPLAARTFAIFHWLWPWGLMHLLAIPAALAGVIAALGGPIHRSREFLRATLLSACYLAWTFQASYLQRQMPYQLVPMVFLAAILLANHRFIVQSLITLSRQSTLLWVLVLSCTGGAVTYALAISRQTSLWQGHSFGWHLLPPYLLALTAVALYAPCLRALIELERRRALRLIVTACFCALALALHPLLNMVRLSLWSQCMREGSTPQLRDRLSLEISPTAPDWTKLEQVRHFLTEQRLSDGELTCYGISAVHLYKEMDLEPSCRFILLWAAILNFPGHRQEIGAELAASRQRFIVNDVRQWGVNREEANRIVPERPLMLPSRLIARIRSKTKKPFPWEHEVVFWTGRYLVHKVRN